VDLKALEFDYWCLKISLAIVNDHLVIDLVLVLGWAALKNKVHLLFIQILKIHAKFITILNMVVFNTIYIHYVIYIHKCKTQSIEWSSLIRDT
jgi:hypothetical protein